ncbi:MAG: hypothetical protein HY822_06050 [Acidobacteria bacterium]|nr:hypothetical protein [Acidobacteriota bacterium]
MTSYPRFVLRLSVFAVVTVCGAQPAREVRRADSGHTTYGEWSVDAAASPAAWSPGDSVRVTAKLGLSAQHLAHLANDNIKVDGFAMLATAERTFDSTGWIRLPSDEKMSTLLTPAGIPIEGGTQGAVTTRFGYFFKTPYDQLVRVPLAAAPAKDGRIEVTFEASQKLPDDLPPGIYRVRLDFGFTVGTRYYSLQAKTFAWRQSAIKGRAIDSFLFLPPIPASGYDAAGRFVDGGGIVPRIPFVLLNAYNSNGNRGVAAEEDRRRFALASRNLIQDDVVLPMYDTAQRPVSYSLEPQFPTDTIDLRTNIPWNFTRGAISLEITAPDGKVTNLGSFPYIANSGQWPTTRNGAVTAWRPPVYGEYTVRLRGWISDTWGNTYQGGGTYRFWIANRMTMATATFQGQPYPVGARYGRDIGFAPAAPADVRIDAELHVNSDPASVRRASWSGKASPAGVYGAAQGAKNLLLDAPGEYYARILATYRDEKGHLWVCSMRHGGVVYSPDSPIVARGKKFALSGRYVERGETRFEGYYDTTEQIGSLVHFNYPWNAGDVLLIASEGQSANKITPELIYEQKDKPAAAWDTRLNGISATNLQIKTSNGYSPHLCPEFITDMGYFYASGPRPGFMSRFLVGEEGIAFPYWQVSPNSFGGQFGASSNGDMPGDIYRLLGGVVLRRKGEEPAYAGYVSSAFILPPGSHNNRVIAPGAEDLLGSTSEKARFFLVGTRPGMMYELGSAFTPAAQIDPILPANIQFSLRYPDGKTVTSAAKGDAGGSAVGARWTLDQPGVYRFHIEGEWEGYRGFMPGLPAEGGDIYVVEAGKPKDAPEIKFNLPVESTFDPAQGVRIPGTTTAETVYYAAVIPGAVIDQGYLPVNGGKFEYVFNPQLINQRVPTYDIQHRVTGRAELGDIVHLTFFTKEKHPNGTSYHSFARIILRGNRIVSTR